MSKHASEATVKLFISYAHEDQELCRELQSHLSVLTGVLGWIDRDISPGALWEKTIYEHLNQADIILLLLSASFFDSNACKDEMNRALERNKEENVVIVPVILRPVLWEKSPVGHFQALPTGAKPVTQWPSIDEAFADITRGVNASTGCVFEKRAKYYLAKEVPALICYVDSNYCYQYVNENYKDWFGFTPDMLGKHVKGILQKRFSEMKPRMDAALSGDLQCFEAVLPHVRLGKCNTLVVYAPHKTKKGIQGFYALVFDRSRDKQAR